MTFYKVNTDREGGNNPVRSPSVRISDTWMKDDFFADDLLHTYEERFCTYTPMEIFATTFNVNGRSPPAKLNDWLAFGNSTPDLIVIGLQEMDLALGSYVVDNPLKESEWLFALQYNLPRGYKLIQSTRLIGIFLAIFVRIGISIEVADVYISSTPTGIFNLGNKGGVGISVRLNDMLVCFVNSHLAAGSNELNRRNQDFRLISQMRFNNGYGVFDHDAVIWLGDLNYRLEAPLAYDEVVKQIRENKFAELFYFDQLKEQQRLRVAFNGFFEQQPSFKPTYKFDPGTQNWDTSEKKRIPAWCDRILYWVRDKNVRLDQVIYISAEKVLLSDHKPVISSFNLQVKKIDQKKRNVIYEQLLRELDKRQNEMLPQISLSQCEFHFGTVYFDQPSVALFSITNSGHTPTHFNFKPARPEESEHPKWLTITPQSSFLDIGATVEITLQILIFDETLCGISSPETELNTIVIVNLTSGRDYFIVIDAKYKRQIDDLIVFD